MWVTKVAPSSYRASSCLPSITQRPEMPASPQRVPVVLQSAAQRSPCGSAARGGRGSAEPPSDSLPCHVLCAPRSSAWLRAGARLWRGRCGRPWEAAARFHVCRGLPAREAGPRAQLLGGPRQLDQLRRRCARSLASSGLKAEHPPLGRHVVPSRRCSAAGLP